MRFYSFLDETRWTIIPTILFYWWGEDKKGYTMWDIEFQFLNFSCGFGYKSK